MERLKKHMHSRTSRLRRPGTVITAWIAALCILCSGPVPAMAQEGIRIGEDFDLETDADLFFHFPFEGHYDDLLHPDILPEPFGKRQFLDGGVEGQCAFFEGESSYVYMDGFAYRLGDNWTISYWTKLTSYCQGTLLANDVLQICYDGGYGAMQMTVKPVDAEGVQRAFALAEPFEKGWWTMVTLTYDSEHKRLSVYSDGVFTDSFRCEPLRKSADRLIIGASTINGDECFIGYLDELCAFERCLSDSEVGDLYASYDTSAL